MKVGRTEIIPSATPHTAYATFPHSTSTTVKKKKSVFSTFLVLLVVDFLCEVAEWMNCT